MPQAVRVGDFCTGHGCFPSRPNLSGSADVFCNDIPAHRVGDIWDIHACAGIHGGITVSGSPDVFVNDMQLARVGDQVDCGSLILNGSPDVEANS
jgi:uncharacterized Zn-binding protein involved in type VI secretion